MGLLDLLRGYPLIGPDAFALNPDNWDRLFPGSSPSSLPMGGFDPWSGGGGAALWPSSTPGASNDFSLPLPLISSFASADPGSFLTNLPYYPPPPGSFDLDPLISSPVDRPPLQLFNSVDPSFLLTNLAASPPAASGFVPGASDGATAQFAPVPFLADPSPSSTSGSPLVAGSAIRPGLGSAFARLIAAEDLPGQETFAPGTGSSAGPASSPLIEVEHFPLFWSDPDGFKKYLSSEGAPIPGSMDTAGSQPLSTAADSAPAFPPLPFYADPAYEFSGSDLLQGGGDPSLAAHGALTAGSFIPGPVGSLAALGDAALSAREGDYLGVGMSTAAAAIGALSDAGAVQASLKGARAALSAARDSDIAGRVFQSFGQLKRALGTYGPDVQWHHIVEQSKISEFGPEAIHSLDNVVPLPTTVHDAISAHYSTKQDFTDGLTVRDWLRGQPWEKQYQYGLDRIKEFGGQ